MEKSKLILNRELEPELRLTLSKFSAFLDQTVDFGVKILEYETLRTREGDANIICLMLLRNILELGDSISILLKQSSIDPSKILIRSLIENSLQIQYLKDDNFENRGLAYAFCQTKKKEIQIKKMIENTDSNNQFERDLISDRIIKSFSAELNQINLKNQLKNYTDIVNSDHYKVINGEFLKIKGKARTNWFELFDGPKNIRDLSKSLGLLSLYEMFFKRYSSNVHIDDTFSGKVFQNSNGGTDIIQMRYFKDAQIVTLDSFLILQQFYIEYLSKREIKMQNEFKEWHDLLKSPLEQLRNNEIIKVNETYG